jgi:hypothetical protein
MRPHEGSLCAQGNCSFWVAKAATGDANGSAVEYLTMVRSLNSALLHRVEAVCKKPTAILGADLRGGLLLRLIDFGIEHSRRRHASPGE